MNTTAVYLLTLAAAVGLSSELVAGTIHVPADAATIQEGIDLAVPGDTVVVAPGVYSGEGNWNLNFGGRDLVLRSAEGAEATIVDGTGSEVVRARAMEFHTETGAAVVEGFTIRNFTGGYVCSGILCDGSSVPTIRDCAFDHNRQTDNIATSLLARGASHPAVVRCRFEENGDWSAWSATVAVVDGATLRMEDCVVSHNLGDWRSGVYAGGGVRAELYRCEIAGNVAWGVTGEGSYVLLDDCVVVENISPWGGGLILEDGLLRGCTVASNWGADGGGGLWVSVGGDVLVDRCLFYGNCGEVGREIAAAGRVQLSCVAVDSAEVVPQHGGVVEWTGPCIGGDPRLCDPAACESLPSIGADYHLRSDSPCLPEINVCGVLIGALGIGCYFPPVGACCDGNGCRLSTESECVASGGFYMGDEVDCDPDPCLPIPVDVTTWGKIKSRYRR